LRLLMPPRSHHDSNLPAEAASTALSRIKFKDSFGGVETCPLSSINIDVPYTQLHRASLATAEGFLSAQRLAPRRNPRHFLLVPPLPTPSRGKLRPRPQDNMDGQTLEMLADTRESAVTSIASTEQVRHHFQSAKCFIAEIQAQAEMVYA